MKFSVVAISLLLFAGRAMAQVPAQPADPNTPLPAQPVQPAVPAVPVQPAAPSLTVPSAGAPGAATAIPAPAATGPQLSILADSSLKAVLSELAQTWANAQDVSPQMPITLTNAGTMRSKIESGGAWDLVIDGDVSDVKALTDRTFLLQDGQRSLARNTLVLYGRAPLLKDDDLEWFDLVGAEWKKVAMGTPSLTVSGRVAQRALSKHDLLDDEHKSIFVNVANETAALASLQRQQADAAFVFRTDLASISLPGFEVVAIKSDDAPPIFYTGAIFRLARNAPLARSFLEFISSAASRPIWMKYGFETD